MNQQWYQEEYYYAPQNNYGSLGAISHSNPQNRNTNLPLLPPPHLSNGPSTSRTFTELLSESAVDHDFFKRC